MDKIQRLRQLLLEHRTQDISKLTFEQRVDFDEVFTQQIMELFTTSDITQHRELLVNYEIERYCHSKKRAEQLVDFFIENRDSFA